MPWRHPPAAIALIALGIFTIWITWRAKSLELGSLEINSKPLMIGKQAPDFHLAAMDGRTVSLSDFRGRKKVVIDFWASWCGPCRLEMPEMRRFYQSAHKGDANFEFLAISIDDDLVAAETAAKHDKLQFPVLLDSLGKTAQGKVIWGETGYQSATEILLATELEIKHYTPQFEGQSDAASH
jgi:peroxiredoxin